MQRLSLSKLVLAVEDLGEVPEHGSQDHRRVVQGAAAKQARAAGRVILYLDHTKFGRQSISALCGLDRIDVIVTDKGAPADLVKALRRKDLDVVLASNG
jgi:DeoR/GlpR family transcriptional regulator of sugar metabolism